MYKYLIIFTLLSLISLSPPKLFAGEILDLGITQSCVMSISEPEPVCIEEMSNRYVNGNYIFRIKLSSNNWELFRKVVLDYDPSGDFFDAYTSHKQTGETIYLSTIIPEAVYPKSEKLLEKKNTISQEFGKTKYSTNHTGIDFSVINSKIYSVFSGVVKYAGWDKFSSKCNNGGNMIKIEHDNGLYSVYMHLKKIFVKQGDRITAGKVIGISGNSGASSCLALKPHLHFEIRTSSNQKDSFNPRNILDI